MSRDARIRLEGKLEVFEASVATLRAAVVRARRGEFRALGAAMDVDVEEVRAEVARVDAALPQLAELRRLRAEAETVVRARARQMGLPEQPVRRTLEALVTEPVSYEGVARHPLGLAGPVVFGLMVIVEVAVMRHPAPLLLHGSMALFLLVMDLLSPRLRVTSRRLFIGAQVFELADLKEIKIEHLMVRSTKRYRLTATLNGGEQVQLRLPFVPEEFTAALRRTRPKLTISSASWVWAWG
jgi:hypothetical protein